MYRKINHELINSQNLVQITIKFKIHFHCVAKDHITH